MTHDLPATEPSCPPPRGRPHAPLAAIVAPCAWLLMLSVPTLDAVEPRWWPDPQVIGTPIPDNWLNADHVPTPTHDQLLAFLAPGRQAEAQLLIGFSYASTLHDAAGRQIPPWHFRTLTIKIRDPFAATTATELTADELDATFAAIEAQYQLHGELLRFLPRQGQEWLWRAPGEDVYLLEVPSRINSSDPTKSHTVFQYTLGVAAPMGIIPMGPTTVVHGPR